MERSSSPSMRQRLLSMTSPKIRKNPPSTKISGEELRRGEEAAPSGKKRRWRGAENFLKGEELNGVLSQKKEPVQVWTECCFGLSLGPTILHNDRPNNIMQDFQLLCNTKIFWNHLMLCKAANFGELFLTLCSNHNLLSCQIQHFLLIICSFSLKVWWPVSNQIINSQNMFWTIAEYYAFCRTIAEQQNNA